MARNGAEAGQGAPCRNDHHGGSFSYLGEAQRPKSYRTHEDTDITVASWGELVEAARWYGVPVKGDEGLRALQEKIVKQLDAWFAEVGNEALVEHRRRAVARR